MKSTRTLKDIGWFEKTDRGLIYLYLTNNERIRISKYQARKIGSLVEGGIKNGL